MSDRPRLCFETWNQLVAFKMHPSSIEFNATMWHFAAIQKYRPDRKKALAPLAICEAKSHFIVTFVIVIVQYLRGLVWTCWIHWILLAHIGTIWHSSQWKAKKTSHTPCVRELSRRSFKRSASSRSFSTCSPSKVSPRTWWDPGMAAIRIHMDQPRVIQSHPESQNVDMPKETNENCRPSGSSGWFRLSGTRWKSLQLNMANAVSLSQARSTGLSQSKTNKPLL